MNGITPSDLRRPTAYKRDYQRELNRRLHLEGRVTALELERDALKYRLQVAEAELKRRGMERAAPTRQKILPITSFLGA